MTSTCCREKAVLVAVYAERPRRRLPLSKNGQGIHRHSYHHLRDFPENEGTRRGYNRKAELLDYTRYLRASAKTDASASIHSSQRSSHATRSPTLQVVATDRKPKHVNSPTCFGKWEFFKGGENSPSTTTRMKGLAKRFQVHKYGSFLAKLSSVVHRCR